MKDENQEKPLPFKPARLIIPSKTTKDQRWIIKFYIWNEQLKDLQMQRIWLKNPDLKARKKEAAELIDEINSLLEKGHKIDAVLSEMHREEKAPKKKITSLEKSIEIYLQDKESKLRTRTFLSYKHHIKIFGDWLEKNQLHKHPLDAINTSHIRRFVKYVEDDPRWGKRSRNNIVTVLKTFFNYFVNDEELIKENPARKEKKIKTPKGINMPYRPEQRKELIKYMQERQPQLLFLTQFIFHTLARPNEISNIQIKHIGMYNHNKIYLKAEHAKNASERHIEISPALDKLLKQHIPNNADPDWYLFSKGFEPGPEHYNSKYFGERYRENVLDMLKYHKDFTLYSWKHTGVVMAVEAGVPHADIISQGGWNDPHSYFTYLKGLGLMVNDGVKTKWPDLLKED